VSPYCGDFSACSRLWHRENPGAKRDKIKKAASVLTGNYVSEVAFQLSHRS
jgi:hypothetical protein